MPFEDVEQSGAKNDRNDNSNELATSLYIDVHSRRLEWFEWSAECIPWPFPSDTIKF